MANETQYQSWTPRGGMNSDDSLVTPSPGLTDSLFPAGDYRYALNARLGSSRNDSFGDFENIRGTTEVTDYWVRQAVVTEETFDTLDAWSQVSSGWIANGGAAERTMSEFLQRTTVIYRPLSPTQRVTVLYRVKGVPDGGNPIESTDTLYFEIVFLTDGIEIESKIYSFQAALAFFTEATVQVNVPEGANQIGFRVTKSFNKDSGFVLKGLIAQVSQFNFTYNTYVAGSRPTGNEKVIGRLEDREFNRLYYAVYNDEDNHCIRFWDPSTARVYELLQWSGLKYQPYYYVKMAKLDAWLGSTDRNNRPRLMNTDTIGDLYLSLGDSDFREFHIAFHKWAPLCPPITKTFFNSGVYAFRGKGVFQFCYRYIYYGGLRSRYSPISTAQPMEEVVDQSVSIQYNIRISIPGVILDDPDVDAEWNYFGHDDPKFIQAVEYIEIAFRRSQVDPWKTWKRVLTADLPDDLSFDFYNTEVDSLVASNDFSQIFDYVPFQAGTIEAIDNRFMFGDCLDEHPVAELPSVQNVGVVKEPSQDNWNRAGGYTSLSAAESTELIARNQHKTFTYKARGMYKICIQYMDRNGWRTLGYTTFNMFYNIDANPADQFTFGGTSFTEPKTALEFTLAPSFRPPKEAVAYQVMRSNCINIDFFIIANANGFDLLIDDPADLKDFASAPDAVKSSINQYFDNDSMVTATEFNDAVVSGEIKSDSPALLNLLRKKAKTNPMIYRMLLDRRKTKTTVTLANASRLYIDINNWVNAAKQDAAGTSNYPMNNVFYDYRRGDRVRFVGSNVAAPSSSQKKIYDAVILEFTGKALVVAKPSGLQWIPPKTSGQNFEDYFVEVYRPNIEVDTDFLYHEIGEWYPILHPLTENRDWSKKNWQWEAGKNAAVECEVYGSGASAIHVFENVPLFLGDCHYKFTTVHTDFPIISTQAGYIIMNPFTFGNEEVYEKSLTDDDRTLAWEHATGRSAPAYAVFPEVRFRTTQVRFGGRIIEESLVNNVNQFRFQDQKIYPSEYGRIRDLVNTSNAQVESVGAILLALGEREAWSIYVNRVTLEDLSGRSQVSLSDQVLGSYNTLLGSHGTLNPESVSTKRGRVYYWDALNKTWVRYGRDGLTALANYKMRNWFKEFGELLINKYTSVATSPLAISGFDAFNEELVTFQDHSDLPSALRGYDTYKGALFSEEDTRWKSIHSIEAEMMGSLNDQFVFFKDGSVFLHESSATHNTFFDVKHDSYIEPIFNIFPTQNKIWQALKLVATEKWSVERLLGEYRGLKTIQSSIIPLENFIDKEDFYWAAFLRDVNSPGITNAVLEGQHMRGKAIQVLLKLDPSVVTRSLLQYIEVGYTPSPKIT